jgi:glycosyltransferase involved in cell wall biosynthesis
MTEALRIVAVLPALNEASTISSVVSQTCILLPVIVVDDGSIDDTGDLAEAAGALVVRHERNCGYEAALSSGLNAAVQNGYTHAITMDADGQHDPSIVQIFIAAIHSGADLVVGRRDRFQRISETIFSLVAEKIWGIADPLCGMKAYKLSLLEKFGPFDSYKSVGTEFTISLLSGGIPLTQVPVKTETRRDTSRFGGKLKGNIRIFMALFHAFKQLH